MTPKITLEEWRRMESPDLSPEEVYSVSNFGRIKSHKLNQSEGVIINGSTLRGYNILNVKLKSNLRTTKYIHKVVAELFLTKDDNLQNCVIHLDFDKGNNHYTNLRWVTRNTMYEHHKLNPNYKKGVITNSKLTVSDVIEIKKKLKRGKMKLYKIALEFGITHTQLNRIRKGENWGHVKIE